MFHSQSTGGGLYQRQHRNRVICSTWAFSLRDILEIDILLHLMKQCSNVVAKEPKTQASHCRPYLDMQGLQLQLVAGNTDKPNVCPVCTGWLRSRKCVKIPLPIEEWLKKKIIIIKKERPYSALGIVVVGASYGLPRLDVFYTVFIKLMLAVQI